MKIEWPFLSDIFANPHDSTPRLIFADWLEEQGREGFDLWRRTELTTEPIETLTKYQRSLIPVCRDYWLSVGLATGRTDEESAQIVLTDVYRAGGLPPPKQIVWLDSPLQGVIAAAVLADKNMRPWSQPWNQILSQVLTRARGQVGSQLYYQIEKHLRTRLGSLIREQLRDQIRGQVWNQAWNQTRDTVEKMVTGQTLDLVLKRIRDQIMKVDDVMRQVWDSASDYIWNRFGSQYGEDTLDPVRNQIMVQRWQCGYGQHDAPWLAFYSFFLIVCGVKRATRLVPLMRLANLCGWWWPFNDICILTRRPTELVTKRMRVVRVRYADGFEFGTASQPAIV